MISVGEKSSKTFKDYYINISRLAKGDYDVLLVSPFTLFQKIPNLDYILNNQQIIKTGEDYSIKELSSKLISMGYINQEMVANKGEFAVRGDLLDVYPINAEKPVRVSFFDTEAVSFFAQTNVALAVLNILPINAFDGFKIFQCFAYLIFPYKHHTTYLSVP